jgi:hypothetical protein
MHQLVFIYMKAPGFALVCITAQPPHVRLLFPKLKKRAHRSHTSFPEVTQALQRTKAFERWFQVVRVVSAMRDDGQTHAFYARAHRVQCYLTATTAATSVAMPLQSTGIISRLVSLVSRSELRPRSSRYSTLYCSSHVR